MSSVEDRSPDRETSTESVTPSRIEPVLTVAKSRPIVSVADEPNSTSTTDAGADEPDEASSPLITSVDDQVWELTSVSENETSWKSCDTSSEMDSSSEDRPPNVAVAEPLNEAEVSAAGSAAETDAESELTTNHCAPNGFFQVPSERPPERVTGGNEPVVVDDTSADSETFSGEAEDFAKMIVRSAFKATAGVDEPMLDQAKFRPAEVTDTDEEITYEPDATIERVGVVAALNIGA